MRIEILEAMGRIGGDGALEAAVAGLAADRWEVRRTAVVALADLGDRRAVPHLARMLTPAHRDLWVHLAGALGTLGSPEHVPALARLMRTADPRELSALVAAVGRLGGPQAAKVLEPLLRHPAWEIQEAAVEAYGSLGEGSDPGPLKPLAGSGDPLLRARAREALRRVLGPDAWDRLLKGSMKKALDDPAEAAFEEATEKLRGKDREGAKRLLRRALRIAKRSEYHALLGSLCMDAGERPEAERHLRRAVALAPHDPVPLVKLGVLQSMLGKHRPAAASLRRVLAMEDLPSPVRELAHRTLAKVHELMKSEHAPSARE
jgi:HEAT repeat protein